MFTILRTALCGLLIVAGGVARPQEPVAPADENLSFQGIQELLERFSDTTMKSVERQLRGAMDAYEDSLEHGGVEAMQPRTYRLVFRLAGTGAPISVLSTGGTYSVVAERQEQETSSAVVSERRYQLTSKGTLEEDGDSVHIEYSGQASLGEVERGEEAERNRSSSISFSGSAVIGHGQEVEIARNDELAVLLRLEASETAARD